MKKKALYSTLKILFVLNLFKFKFKFFPDIFGHAGKRLDKKATVNFKIYDIINWETNNYNTHTAQYSRKKGN